RLCDCPVEVHGSGRTDAGVHALGQVANFHLPAGCPVTDPGEIREYLNRYLPEDINILSAQKVPLRFHSRLNAVSKTYLYRIETAPKKNVFQRKYVYGLGQSPDVARMREAAELLVGTHDFRSFCSLKRMKKSTVRTITSIEFHQEGTVLELSFTGDGFLYNMVRILTGTLLEVGLGQRTVDSVLAALDGKDRVLAGFMAPSEGLFLKEVRYPEE
ncbi:MAG: tRNA pseudouridine(38-40) synthase TruA, partial [Clostridiaceae bacterium]|nr:tRNA pseudouridine(38-40) synthase TruA [Clostridiaceae bacterium]